MFLNIWDFQETSWYTHQSTDSHPCTLAAALRKGPGTWTKSGIIQESHNRFLKNTILGNSRILRIENFENTRAEQYWRSVL